MLGHGFKNGVVKVTLSEDEYTGYYDSVSAISQSIKAENEVTDVVLNTLETDQAMLNDHVNALNHLFQKDGKLERAVGMKFEHPAEIFKNILDDVPAQVKADFAACTTREDRWEVITYAYLIKGMQTNYNGRDEVLTIISNTESAAIKTDKVLELAFQKILDPTVQAEARTYLAKARTAQEKYFLMMVAEELWKITDEVLKKQAMDAVAAAPLLDKKAVVEAWYYLSKIPAGDFRTEAMVDFKAAVSIEQKAEVARAYQKVFDCLSGIEDADIRAAAIADVKVTSIEQKAKMAMAYQSACYPLLGITEVPIRAAAIAGVKAASLKNKRDVAFAHFMKWKQGS